MTAFEYHLDKIIELKKNNLLTDAVKLVLAGMFTEDDITPDEYHKLMRIMEFDYNKFGAVLEAAFHGDIEDYKNQKVDHKLS